VGDVNLMLSNVSTRKFRSCGPMQEATLPARDSRRPRVFVALAADACGEWMASEPVQARPEVLCRSMAAK